MKVFPGQIVGSLRNHEAGVGTYVQGDKIMASLLGLLLETNSVLSIQSSKDSGIKIGQVVTCKCTRIEKNYASVTILVGEQEFLGMIQKKDVQKHLTDSLEIYRCFRPGDVIRARVAALGEQRSYLLTTASNDLGVVIAQSLTGHAMTPINWVEMQCPVSGVIESRKCCSWQ